MNRFSDQSKKYHLEPLHLLLETKIPTATSIQYPLPDELEHQLIVEVEQAANMARRDIAGSVLEMDEHEAQRYIRFYQHQLGKLINGLILCTGKPALTWYEIKIDDHRLCQWLFRHLDDLMEHLEQRYSKYFDYDEIITYGYKSVNGRLMQIMTQTSQRFLEQLVDPELAVIATLPIIRFVSHVEPNESYRYAFYIKRLADELCSHLGIPESESEREMHILLHQLEFNNPDYIRYYQDYMRRMIRDTSPHNTLQVISDFRAFVIQYSNELAEPFYPQGERLTTVMVRWLDAELVRIQQSGTSEPPLTVNEALGNTEEKAPKEKALFNGAVKELGLLLRLGVEADLINDVNIREICRQASALFSTVNTEEPSEKSIYKSFFTPEPAAIERLIPILKKLLEFLQQPEIPPYVKKDKRGKNPEKD
jgi:hypothetical protein